MTDIKKTISAGGVVRKIVSGKAYIVLTREPERPAWVLPKGHQEEGETLEQAAAREVKEETGLEDVEIVKKLGTKQRLSYEGDEYKTIHYFLFDCFGETTLPKECVDVDKILRPEWFPIDNLPQLFWQEQKDLLQENLKIIMAYGKQRNNHKTSPADY